MMDPPLWDDSASSDKNGARSSTPFLPAGNKYELTVNSLTVREITKTVVYDDGIYETITGSNADETITGSKAFDVAFLPGFVRDVMVPPITAEAREKFGRSHWRPELRQAAQRLEVKWMKEEIHARLDAWLWRTPAGLRFNLKNLSFEHLPRTKAAIAALHKITADDIQLSKDADNVFPQGALTLLSAVKWAKVSDSALRKYISATGYSFKKEVKPLPFPGMKWHYHELLDMKFLNAKRDHDQRVKWNNGSVAVHEGLAPDTHLCKELCLEINIVRRPEGRDSRPESLRCQAANVVVDMLDKAYYLCEGYDELKAELKEIPATLQEYVAERRQVFRDADDYLEIVKR